MITRRLWIPHTTVFRRRAVSYRSLTTVGLRREDPKRIWERRTPLTPPAIAELISGGDVAVQVESCRRRCFPDRSYEEAGARIVPSLSPGVDLVLGIKEPPVAEVRRLLEEGRGKSRTWMVFSHTHKGQEYNTELLSTFLGDRDRQTLIDHELLTKAKADGKGQERVAAFGWYAGAVGAGEALTMTGLALLKRGIATPLLHLSRPYSFNSLADYKAAIAEAAQALQESPPEEPIVIGVTGHGNVAQGAMAILDAANPIYVEGSRLRETLEGGPPSGRLIVVQVDMTDYMRQNGRKGSFNRDAYYANPAAFTSHFDVEIAPYLTTLINGQGWSRGFPRVMDVKQLDSLIAPPNGSGSKPQKLAAVQDITCDIKGNLEFMDRHTTIDQPYYEGPGGIMISSIDILPTELPKDASEHFSSRILPYVQHITSGGQSPDIAATLQGGTIVNQGTITKPHEWLLPRVTQWRESQSSKATEQAPQRKKKVLLLGSGLVAGPAAQVLGSRSDLIVRLASNDLRQSNEMSAKYSNMSGMELDVMNDLATNQAVAEADVVISLLPAPMHTMIAKHCIQHRKHLVTASYVSEEMQALNEQAAEAGITILGECGLDPGIDSMAAMRIIDRAKRQGKRVSSFISWCGGLPELSASEVPLRYKFSWSPKAVLTAALNDARYKLSNTVAVVPGSKLLEQHFPSVELWDDLPLEGLANRDSIPYAEKYDLGPVEGLRDLFRGTLRYQGFSRLMDSFRLLGLLNTEALRQTPSSWPELLLESVRSAHTIPSPCSTNDLPSIMRDVVAPDVMEETIEALRWLGILSHSSVSQVSMTHRPGFSSMDYFAQLLSARLSYGPGERDSTLLHHSFILHPESSGPSAAGTPGQTVTASLLAYGNQEASAMATTVGKTLAFAALRVLDGKVAGRGVRRPVDRDVYEGVLDDLEEVGVKVEEKWT